jgi:hypothetical protein
MCFYISEVDSVFSRDSSLYPPFRYPYIDTAEEYSDIYISFSGFMIPTRRQMTAIVRTELFDACVIEYTPTYIHTNTKRRCVFTVRPNTVNLKDISSRFRSPALLSSMLLFCKQKSTYDVLILGFGAV